MRREALEGYRDDGLLARALGSALGRVAKLPPFLFVGAGVVGVLAVAAVEGDGASDAAVGACIAWLVVLGGISHGRPHTDRFAWSVPGLLRVGEYAALVLVAAAAGDSTLPAAFALIGALTFRHYDLVYRPRFQGVEPPGWVQLVSGGWDGRLVVVWVLLVIGALPAALFVMAAALGALFVAECASSWVRPAARAVAVYEDEEDEGQ